MSEGGYLPVVKAARQGATQCECIAGKSECDCLAGPGPLLPAREGDWIQTFTGRQFWPLDPRPEEISIIDIAAGLARECRFAGHCLRFYTVAEHSVLMYRAAKASRRHEGRVLRAVLLHDASEGLGLRDIPRPIKRDLGRYKEIEAGVMRAVAARFQFSWPMPAIVKILDESIGLAEQIQNMAPAPAAWRTQIEKFEAIEPLPVALEYWNPERAFAEFLSAAAELGLLT